MKKSQTDTQQSVNLKKQDEKNLSEKALGKLIVVIKGSGEMATGVAHRLYMANIRRILMTDIPEPTSVRRTVAFSEAVYDGKATVEGVTAVLIEDPEEAPQIWEKGQIAVMVDPEWTVLKTLRPDVVVDAIMAKRNSRTLKREAPLVIGIGPGFTASENVHIAVESNRGHDLGRVILEGSTEPPTGIPGSTMGYTTERVLRAPRQGMLRHVKKLGDEVKKGDVVLYVGEEAVKAPLDGILRGLIREMEVPKGKKIGDVDPRGNKEYCFTITEKARAIGGGVLEAIMHVYNR